MRTHRPGDAAFRRGSPVGEGSEQASPVYRPYQPEPEDELVLPGGGADQAGPAYVDNTPPGFDESPLPLAVEPPPLPVAPPPAPPATPSPVLVVADEPRPREPQPVPWKPPPTTSPAQLKEEPEAQPPRWSAPVQPYGDGGDRGGYDDRYRPPEDEWNRRGPGMSPLAIGGFVLLGVLAIGVGAFIAGVFSGGAAVASPSPTPLVSAASSATAEASLKPTPGASLPASTNPTATPVPLPDGFTARTEPCAEEPSSQDGCSSSGATVSGGTVWAWIGFRTGNSADVLGVNIVDASGASVGHGSKALATLGCGDACAGWLRFKFGGLNPGNYTIRVDRNGLTVAEAPFTVSS